MLFLRLQSVFLSLVLYVILFLVLYNTSEEIFVFFFFLCFFPILRPFFYGTFIIIGSIYFLDICKVVKNTFVVSMIYSFIIIVIPSYLNFYLYHTPNITPLLIPMVLTLCLYIFLKKKDSKILILVHNIFCIVSFVVIFLFFNFFKFDRAIIVYIFQNVLGLFMAKWMKNKLSKIRNKKNNSRFFLKKSREQYFR
jgi:hypothetical protein